MNSRLHNYIARLLRESPEGLLHMPGQIGPPDYYAASQPLSIASAPNVNGVAVASAATITLDYFLTNVTGTTNTSLIKIPTGLRGLVRVIKCAAALPLVTGGTYAASDGTYESLPVAVAVTGAANKCIALFSDGLLLYPILSA